MFKDQRKFALVGAGFAAISLFLSRLSKATNNTSQNSDQKARKMILVTDIGRDIDDTFALQVLATAHKSHQIELLGIVTSGGCPGESAGLVRAWLPRFGLDLYTIPVAADDQKLGPSHIVYPEWYDPSASFPFDTKETGAELIMRLCETHSDVELLIIAPLTPVAEAIYRKPAIIKSIKCVHIQGQADVKESADGKVILTPNMDAFNLRIDPMASETVYEKLQHVPFTLLGKHAAYRVSLHKKHFDADTRVLIRAHLAAFRKSNPELFEKVYKVSATEENWFEELDELSHPYDPLLVLAVLKGEIFDSVQVQHHTFIGNIPEEHGVKDPELARTELLKVMQF